ncbi:hypothetical protein FQN57_006293 [Myotisia sp. PD_48]|nr:hypothetical protein FQN57_006293 [Myotisia sp. PD_48]
MAAVSQTTLEWLSRVLTNAYHDPNRTYNDAVQLLARFPSFDPKTNVYTYENGASALFLQFTGTLPVSFRGVVYRFPITVWVPNTYPNASPIIYVTPTADMLVRPGQHVSVDGRVYHHYLAHWKDARDRSTLVDFLSILIDVFAKEPPVISKDAHNGHPSPLSTPSQKSPAPPPMVPPLPVELMPPPKSRPHPHTSSSDTPPPPPQLPPKPGATKPPEPQGRTVLEERYQKPPPLPPLPPELQPPPSRQQDNVRLPISGGVGGRDQYLPQRSSSLRREVVNLQQSQTQESHAAGRPRSLYRPEAQNKTVYHAPTPMVPNYQHADRISPSYTGSQHQQNAPQHLNSQAVHSPYRESISRPQSFPPPQLQLQFQHEPQPQPQHQLEPQPQKQQAPDLLTSSFDIELPSKAADLTPPPIPPNPEKDVLLQTLSTTLTQILQSNLEQANSALQPLDLQSKSLHSAIDTLRSEITALNNFHMNLQSNTQILQQSLRRADAVIANAKARISPSELSQPLTSSQIQQSSVSATEGKGPGLPPIDEVLVAPTVVGKQIYDLVAEERGIQRAIYALQSALVKGRVGVDIWAKLTRSLAREAFLKRALIQKAARGMGLNMGDDGT